MHYFFFVSVSWWPRKYFLPSEVDSGCCPASRHSKNVLVSLIWKIYPRRKFDGKCITHRKTAWLNRRLVGLCL